jgi:ferredoxin
VKVRLDRTLCDGFGVCAKHAPKHFSLDDWGYASLEGNGNIDPADHDPVMRALLDCPVHAIIATFDDEPIDTATAAAKLQTADLVSTESAADNRRVGDTDDH